MIDAFSALAMWPRSAVAYYRWRQNAILAESSAYLSVSRGQDPTESGRDSHPSQEGAVGDRLSGQALGAACRNTTSERE